MSSLLWHLGDQQWKKSRIYSSHPNVCVCVFVSRQWECDFCKRGRLKGKLGARPPLSVDFAPNPALQMASA